MINLSPLAGIGIGLAVLFFGYFFGLFEGRSRGYNQRKKEDALENRSKPPLPTPPSAPASPTEKSLLKLSLDQNNQPVLMLDGNSIDTTQLTAEERARLIDLMLTMRPWVQPGTEAKGAQGPQAAPRPFAAQTPPLAAPSPGPKPAPAAAAPNTPATPQKDEAAPSTMVAQIDTILQKSLIGTPLGSLGIRLVESVQGNVTVVVGVNKYAGVGDVPDPQVKAAIKAAIAEWEKKYTPS
jgi:hypothetical protein